MHKAHNSSTPQCHWWNEMSKNRASENVYVTPVNMHHQLTLNSTTVSSGCSTTVLWLEILSASVGLIQLSGNLLPSEFEGQIPHGLVNELHSVFKLCSYPWTWEQGYYHSCRHDYRVSLLSTLLNYIHAYMYYVVASILLACKDARMSIHQIPQWYLVL